MFTAESDALNRVAVDGDKGRQRLVEVDVLPLDEILQVAVPLLLKVDVEGFEPQVLSGAARTLSNPALKAIIIETMGHEKRYGYGPAFVHDMLADNGFLSYDYQPFGRKIAPCPWSPEGKASRFNSLYLRDLEFVERRIASTPIVEVLGARF